MNTSLAVLKKCDLFQTLPLEVIEKRLLPLGQIREFPKGKHIIAPQDKVDSFGIVTAGRLNVMHVFENGNCSLSAALGPSDVLGADLVCTRSRIPPYYVVSASPAQVVFFPADMVLVPGALEEPCRQEILRRLLMYISHDSMKKEYRFAILSRKGLRERILTYLTMQANKRGTNTITIPFTRDELASYLCVNRSALSHELSLMRQEGLIAFRKNRFTLLHWKTPDLLEEFNL